MSAPVTLLMAIHCHQPVGNFDFVFEEAFKKSYEPFLEVLQRHPGVKLALHYSGPLLDWLLAHQPGFIERVRQLAARGQVELLASGYYEPILPLIPEHDRQGQIALMRQAVRRHFGAEAAGLWLTERVWEPQLPQSLARAGIGYTMLDTNQFAQAGLWLSQERQVRDEQFWDLLGSYTTDYEGESLRLFPASKRLRYAMPFKEVSHTIDFLRTLARDEPVAVTFADDGEKFGFWPKTYQWVYAEGWLDKFFSALERQSPWLSTATFREYVEATPADGHVYLPCGSYEEMLEWSNGYFRNFFTKYPEANAMQQAMLRVSETLQRVASGEWRVAKARKSKTHSTLLKQARQQLYAAQCNCAYWHGVFGGLYLSHLRRAVYGNLVSAEKRLNQLADGPVSVVMVDADGDGTQEVALTTPQMRLVADPGEGAAVSIWNLYGKSVNLLDTLSRRPESYHSKLTMAQTAVVAGKPLSIHDVVNARLPDLSEHLVYDDHVRYGFLDYGFQSLPSLQEVARSAWGERRLWGQARWQQDGAAQKLSARKAPAAFFRRAEGSGVLRKSIHVDGKQPSAAFSFELKGVDAPVVALEFNIGLRDERLLAAAQSHESVTDFKVTEDWSGIQLTVVSDPPALLYTFPVETVSESESGMEKTFQGLCLVWLWRTQGESFRSRLAWTVK